MSGCQQRRVGIGNAAHRMQAEPGLVLTVGQPDGVEREGHVLLLDRWINHVGSQNTILVSADGEMNYYDIIFYNGA